MELLRRLYTLYNDLNPATLSGAIDVIVVRQPDGSLKASPFHVRFGKVNLLRSKKQRFVRIRINGESVALKMCVGSAGECYFMDEEEELMAMASGAADALSPVPAAESIVDELASLASSVAESLASSPPNLSPKATDDEDNVPMSPTSLSASEQAAAGSNGPEIEQWEWGSLPVSEVASDSGVANSGSEDADTLERTRRTLGSSSDSVDAQTSSHITPAAAVPAASTITDTTAADSKTTPNPAEPATQRAARPPPLTIPEDTLATSFVPAHQESGTSQSAPETAVTTPTNGSPKRGWMKNIKSLFTGGENRPLEDEEDSLPEGGVYLNQVRPVPDDAAGVGYYSSEEETRVIKSVSGNNLAAMNININNEDDLDNISFHSTHEDLTMEAGSSSSSRSSSPLTVSERHGHASHSVSNAVNIPRPGDLNGASSLNVPNAANQLSSSLPPNLAHVPSPLTLSSSLTSTDSVMEMMRSASDAGSVTSTANTSLHDQSFFGAQNVAISLCGGLGHAPNNLAPLSSSLSTSYSNNANSAGNLSSSGASSGVGSPATTPVPLPSTSPVPTLVPNPSITKETFEKYLVTFDQFQKNPALLTHPDLVVRINNSYYTWAQAAPLIMSMVVFQRPLFATPPQSASQTVEEPKKAWKSWGSWWSWGRRDDASKSSNKDATGGNGVATPTNGTPPTPTVLGASDTLHASKSAKRPADATPSTPSRALSSSILPGSTATSSPAATVRPASADASLPSASPSRVEALKGGEKGAIDGIIEDGSDPARPQSPFKRSRKGLRLSSEQLKSLNLKDGANLCEFSIITKLQGKATVKCVIYLWDHSDRVVISDIDGTITKSDVLGHAAALVGTDWTQMGVASLFSSVEKNGYRFLYLSSRSISHAGPTRAYVKGVKQQAFQLPDGPIMLSPASLFQSLHREVILRKPEVFKIACLQDILSLFPTSHDHHNPFTAGFGNRNTDVISYLAVGIPSNRIFIIDPKGLVKVPSSAFRSSYQKLNDIVHEMFPPVPKSIPLNKQFGSFEYWHVPPPLLSEEELALMDM